MTPVCLNCGALIRRQRVKKRLENISTFLSREFCDTDCIKEHFAKKREIKITCMLCGSQKKMQIGNDLCDSCLMRESCNQFLTKRLFHDKSKVRKTEEIM
ncbi:hypothetical protein LCGC14_2838410 [marine sediment metagenome]|uniref:Uncharacterized protein n=1 Tax=marine sediment metagenome TaxID=412755 RepID=A0A0F8YYM9_9ZZZZ